MNVELSHLRLILTYYNLVLVFTVLSLIKVLTKVIASNSANKVSGRKTRMWLDLKKKTNNNFIWR